MKSREITRIRTVERIIENTHAELERPEVQDALGEFAVRTIHLVEKLYAPPVIGGEVLVPSARLDTEWIPMVVSRSSRKLTYPTEVTPTQVQRFELEKAQNWRNVCDSPLTPAEIAKLDEYDYTASVKRWPIRHANLGSRGGGVTFAVTHPSSVIYDCSVKGGAQERTVEMCGKPLVTIDAGYTATRTPRQDCATMVHELQHVDDMLNQPIAVYDTALAETWEDDDSLRSELRAYGVHAAYLRALGIEDEHVAEIARIRAWHNGWLLDSPEAFLPSQDIKKHLAEADLSSIYR